MDLGKGEPPNGRPMEVETGKGGRIRPWGRVEKEILGVGVRTPQCHKCDPELLDCLIGGLYRRFNRAEPNM
jgi:hypothetical protein